MRHAMLACIVVAFAACGRQSDNLQPKGLAKSEPLVTITPTEFFSGELKRLEAHVDFRAYCFKIKTHGSLRCSPSVEMWCDGQRVDRPRYAIVSDATSDEITFSHRRFEKKDGTTQYGIAVGGIDRFARYIDEPLSKQVIDVAFGPIAIRAPVELKAEGDSAIVWAVDTGRGIDLSKPAEAEKNLKAAPWALVLRVVAEKKK